MAQQKRDEYINREALNKLPDAVRKVIEYIIEKHHPLLISQYPDGWDVLDTGIDPQILIVTEKETPTDERLKMIYKKIQYNADFSHEWIDLKHFMDGIRYGFDPVIPAIKDGIVIYSSHFPFVSQTRMMVNKKSKPITIEGSSDSINVLDWVKFSVDWFTIASYAHRKKILDPAAFSYYTSAEVSLKALYILKYKSSDYRKYSHDIRSLVKDLTQIPSIVVDKVDFLSSIQGIKFSRYPQPKKLSSADVEQIRVAAWAVVSYCYRMITGTAPKLPDAISGPPGRSRKGSAPIVDPSREKFRTDDDPWIG